MSMIWMYLFAAAGVFLLGMLAGSSLDTAHKRELVRERAAWVREYHRERQARSREARARRRAR
ncbi:MAG: hypothetical protein ACT4O0_09630 [Pseudonocardia sp.]